MKLDYEIIKEFLGKTLVSITDAKAGDDHIRFEFNDGTVYNMYHDQECCEHVRIEDVSGDLSGLIARPLLVAEIAYSNDYHDDVTECATWSFYRLATIKEFVVIRWLGESNGWYSETVDIVQEK